MKTQQNPMQQNVSGEQKAPEFSQSQAQALRSIEGLPSALVPQIMATNKYNM